MNVFRTSGFPAATILALSFFAQSELVKAQEDGASARRPKIGLVLSGGGALGVAHVGALKALEELHIPIDYLAGTSMGAIVGGLYASGMSPAELDVWFRRADWQVLLSDSLPRESESFRKKQRKFDINQGIAFNVSRKQGLSLPAGLVAGRNAMASLRQLTVPVRHIHDFDQLPIPFRAVAADIETGDVVVLREGDLVESIRASMSIPAIFTPQRIGERLLVDGGIANNLPVSVVQEMGADMVIAIDTAEQLKKESELGTAPAMANQVLSIFIQRQTREEIARLRPGDAVVRIKVDGLGPTDFANAAKGIDAAYEQVMQQRALLARFPADPDTFRRFVARQRVPREEAVMISFLKVQTPEGEFEHVLPEPIEFEVREHEPFARLQSMLGDLGELQPFEVADYQVIGKKGDYGLLVKASRKKIGPTNMSFGFGFGYSTADETDFGLLLSYRMTELNRLGAEWATHLSLGNTTRLVTEWYQPVDWERRFFVDPYGVIGNDFIDGREADGDGLSFRQQDYAAGLDIGARIMQAGEFRAGYARGYTRTSRRLGAAEELPENVDRARVHADLTVDTLDAPAFATRGAYGRVSLVASREEMGASDNYTRLEGQFYRPVTFGKHTIVPRVSAAIELNGGDVPLYDQVPLGGFLNLTGLSRGYLFGENTALAQLIYYRKISGLTAGVGRGLYAGCSLEAGEAWDEARDFDLSDAIISGSVFLGADTLLGGIYFGLGVAEGGDAAVYLQMGSPFGQGRHRR